MGPRYMSTTFVNEQEEAENSPENNGDSPQSSMLNDNQIPSSSSPKKSKRSIQKRVISVSMKDVEVSRSKGEMGTPPSDSWAWRKYGQKPIKGSPYYRAYYRCSSSKGCPARKQVERSRLDAKMLTITYSCERNHPWPTIRSSTSIKFTSSNSSTSPNARTTTNSQEYEEKEECHEKPKNSSLKRSEDSKTNHDEDKFGNLGEGALVNNYGLWFSDHFESTSSTMLVEIYPN